MAVSFKRTLVILAACCAGQTHASAACSHSGDQTGCPVDAELTDDQVLLQARVNLAAKTDDEDSDQDDDEDEQEEGGGEVGEDASDDHDTMQSNVNTTFAAGTSVQSVDAEYAEGLLSLKFHHEGNAFEYKLQPHNLYSDDAQVRLGEELLEVKRTTYRASGQEGKWAAASLHDDGSIQGLFLHGKRLIHIAPVQDFQIHEGGDTDVQLASLLEGFTGSKVPHLIQWVEMPMLVEGPGCTDWKPKKWCLKKKRKNKCHKGWIKRRCKLTCGVCTAAKEATTTTTSTQAPTKAPPMTVATTTMPAITDKDDSHLPRVKAGPFARPEEEAAMNTSTWGGDKWAGDGSCYKGDTDMHEMIIGIYTDPQMTALTGSRTQSLVEAAVNQASFVYEMQMHIKFKIGDLKMNNGDFGSCGPQLRLDDMVRLKKAGKMPQMAISHVFSGCGWPSCTSGGKAYLGSLCGWQNTGMTCGRNVAIPRMWIVFAHEVGHNFDAGHTFHEGKGVTGGIMDYGDGKLNHHYQFNTKYQKKKICAKLNRVVDKCAGKFQKESGSSRTADRARTKEVTKADIQELSKLNAATGTTYTLTKGAICRANWKDGGKVDATACAQLCKQRIGCTEFSVGGGVGQNGCRYANGKGGCCNEWKRFHSSHSAWKATYWGGHEGWDNDWWKAKHCTPFQNINAGDCMMGGCRLYSKKVVTTQATRWSQFGPTSSRCSKRRLYTQWKVVSQDACQDSAVDAGHPFYQYFEKRKLCATYATCSKPRMTNGPWKIYASGKSPRTITKTATVAPNVPKYVRKDCADKKPKRWCLGRKHRCRRNWIKKNCELTCDVCRATPVTPTKDCADKKSKRWCLGKKYRCGREGIKKKCKRTCGVCKPISKTAPAAPTKAAAKDCADKKPKKWCLGRKYRCGGSWIKKNCKRTCGVCK
jgi:hypothetical protein